MKSIDNITTEQAKSICILILQMDQNKIRNMKEVEMRTEARAYLRSVKQSPTVALSTYVKPYARKTKPVQQ